MSLQQARARGAAARSGPPPPLDPFVWKACAGCRVKIPAVGSWAYYFPGGHVEQSSSPPDFSAVVRTKPYVHCRVASVEYRADQVTDEVYTRMTLDPRPDPARAAAEDGDAAPAEAAAAFAKILTPSDANNGGGFSVPRFCADSIFPGLDFSSETPVQTLVMRDLLGNEWKFRHIYRGTPRRHLLTTGWSKFVNAKKLVAGDSVVFIRNSAGEIFVGIRRRNAAGVAVESVEGEGFVRNGRGRVAAQAVVEAVRAAEAGDRAFEVEYYPRNRAAEFVVAEEEVVAAMQVRWAAGMKVRLGVETEDAVRVTWHQGTVEGIALAVEGPWALSPWRMLKINWENPQLLQTMQNVNPWQVQFPSSNEPPRPPIGELGILQHPVSELGNTVMGHLLLPPLNNKASPEGIQGTRHEPNNSSQPSHSENISGSDLVHELNGACSEASPTSTLPHESILPYTKGSLNDSGSPNKRPRIMSFQLFGRVIETKQSCGIDVLPPAEQEDIEGAVQSVDPSYALHTKATSPASPALSTKAASPASPALSTKAASPTSPALPTKATSPTSPAPIPEHELEKVSLNKRS